MAEGTAFTSVGGNPQISISFSDGVSEKQRASMPSVEEMQRAFGVMSGLIEPEKGNSEEEKMAPKQTDGNQEKLINNKLLDARFIEAASYVQRCICRIVTNSGCGTGFRIAQRLIMTAAHVLKDDQQGYVQFHYYEPRLPNQPGGSHPEVAQTFQLDADQLYYSNTDLDFAVVAIQADNPDDFKEVEVITSVQVHDSITKSHTNIFSHPEGNPMKVSLRENVALETPKKVKMMAFDKVMFNFDALSSKRQIVIHEADTQSGSSGAPIFNDHWQLIAIHQGAVQQKKSDQETLVSNYGCIIKYILSDMYSMPGAALTDFEVKLRDQADFFGIPFGGSKFTKNFEQSLNKKPK